MAIKQAIIKFDMDAPSSDEEIRKAKTLSTLENMNLEHDILSNCHFPLIVGVTDYFQEGVDTRPVKSGSETTYVFNQYLVEEFVDGTPLDHLERLGMKSTYIPSKILFAKDTARPKLSAPARHPPFSTETSRGATL